MPSTWAVAAAKRILNHLDVEDFPMPLATIIDQVHAAGNPLMMCAECGGWFEPGKLHPDGAQPDAAPMCDRCLQNDRLLAELRQWKPMTPAEADAALAALGPASVSDDEVSRLAELAMDADKQRIDWLETQLCWIGMQGTLEVNPKYTAGGPCRRTVREACDAGILADRSTESA